MRLIITAIVVPIKIRAAHRRRSVSPRSQASSASAIASTLTKRPAGSTAIAWVQIASNRPGTRTERDGPGGDWTVLCLERFSHRLYADEASGRIDCHRLGTDCLQPARDPYRTGRHRW